jgi:hypothetical protein
MFLFFVFPVRALGKFASKPFPMGMPVAGRDAPFSGIMLKLEAKKALDTVIQQIGERT